LYRAYGESLDLEVMKGQGPVFRPLGVVGSFLARLLRGEEVFEGGRGAMRMEVRWRWGLGEEAVGREDVEKWTCQEAGRVRISGTVVPNDAKQSD
jgi:hypothetical protein